MVVELDEVQYLYKWEFSQLYFYNKGFKCLTGWTGYMRCVFVKRSLLFKSVSIH